ncbi:ribonuclease HII [Candidatus Shapirobacteria bacterium]|nr:ribonuclease HII [Candidatus Shapirobacteria bacterium]
MNLPDFNFESSLLPPNCRYLLGIDEVGRGPLAGPVTIGAFLLDLNSFNPADFIKLGVRDSKLLSHQRRQQIYQHFLKNKYIFKTFSASSKEIDKQGIAVCIYSLMNQSLKHFENQFDFCLIDGLPFAKNDLRSNDFFEASNVHRTLASEKKSLQGKHRYVVKGDAQCFSVAAASICAKVVRDEFMEKLDREFPHYGFSQHKGYGTKKHLEAIARFGPSPHHRFSFKPISLFQGEYPR